MCWWNLIPLVSLSRILTLRCNSQGDLYPLQLPAHHALHAPTLPRRTARPSARYAPSTTACVPCSFTRRSHPRSGPKHWPRLRTLSIAVPVVPLAPSRPTSCSSACRRHMTTSVCLAACAIPTSPPPPRTSSARALLPARFWAIRLTTGVPML
jgi:hypothetical protein